MPDEMLDILLGVLPGGKKYPVKINANDEELVREAAKQLRLKFISYKQAFSDTDLTDEDLMIMVAIDIAVSHLHLERNNDMASFNTRIQQLNKTLKDYLKAQ